MSRDKIRHVDLRPDEFIAGTFGQLSLEQFAVYWAVCLSIYSKGGPVDFDVDRFVAAFKWDDRVRYRNAKVRDALDDLIGMGKLKVGSDGKLSNGRTMDELVAATNRLARARENGARGGRPPGGTSAREPHGSRMGATPRLRRINGLAKPAGYELLKEYESESFIENITDAAREPSPEPQASQARAHTEPEPERRPPAPTPKTQARLAPLAAEARRKLMGGA